MGRLKYAYKIVLIPTLLLLPLAWVLTAYVGVQNGQMDFSAKERDGVAYLLPLASLAASTAAARHDAVAGRPPPSLHDAVAKVEDQEGRLGAELGTGDAWTAAKTALGRVGGASTPRDAFTAYNAAEDALITLIVKVSDGSNLTLDPDLDTYYAMDSLVFRLPPLLQAAGRAVDEAVLTAGADARTAEDARINLALNRGTPGPPDTPGPTRGAAAAPCARGCPRASRRPTTRPPTPRSSAEPSPRRNGSTTCPGNYSSRSRPRSRAAN